LETEKSEPQKTCNPDAKSQGYLVSPKDVMKRDYILFLKMLPVFFRVIVIFLVILFLMFLPLSVMNLGYKSRLEFIQNYSKTLGETGTTAFIALVAVSVSDLFKSLYKLIRRDADNMGRE